MAIEDIPIPHGLPSFSRLKKGTSLEKRKEIRERVDEKNRSGFEKEIISDEFTTEMADKIFSEYGKEALPVLFIRLSPNALLSLLEKVSVAVLKDIFKGTEDEVNAFERKMAILKSSDDKKNIKSWKDRFDVLLIKAADLPVNAGDFDEKLAQQTPQQKPEGTPENPVQFIPHGEEAMSHKVIPPDKRKDKIVSPENTATNETIMTPEEEARIFVRLIKSYGYTILPHELRTGIVHDPEKMKEIISVLLELHLIIKKIDAYLFAHKKEKIELPDDYDDHYKSMLVSEYPFVPDVTYPEGSNEQEHKGEGIAAIHEADVDAAFRAKYGIDEEVDVEGTIPMKIITDTDIERYEKMVLRYGLVVVEFDKYLREKFPERFVKRKKK